jgi:iron complex outermembrane receptor protein
MRSVYSLLLFACATSAGAQVDTMTRRDTARLAPTVVTVTRIPLELSRAPFAVGVTDRAEIQRGKPGFALDEALGGIAGVQVDNRFNYALGERIAIRGFGARAQFGTRGVRVLLDGIPMTIADGQTALNNVDVSTLARAEVIRGPASALHGNASGGVIQLESDAVVSDRALGGTLRTDVGEHGLLRQRLQLGGRKDSTAYSVSGSRMFFDGYRQWNDATNDHVGFRVRHRQARRDVAVTGNWVEYDAKNPGGLTAALLQTNRDTAAPINFSNRTGERGRQGQLGAAWREQFQRLGVELSVHGLRRQVDNPIPFTIVAVDRDAGGARLALVTRRSIAGRGLTLASGAELQVQRDHRRNFANNGGVRDTVNLDQDEAVDNTALFIQGSFGIASNLLVMAGARLDRVRFDVTDNFIQPANPDDSGERTMRAATPSVGLTWSPTGSIDVYANYAESFDTPTTSELANQPSGAGGMNQGLDPQRVRSVEVGWKHRVRLGSTAASYRVAAYRARVEDALIPFELTPGGRSYYQNAGSTKNRGIEVEAMLVFPKSLSLRTTYTHTDARFDEFVETRGGVTNVYNGKQVPAVAANRADATLSFQPNRFFADFETRSVSSIQVDNANTQRSPSYTIHSARLGLRNVRAGGVELEPSLGVLNLFDREYNTSVAVNANGGRFFEPGPPRSVYGGLNARF